MAFLISRMFFIALCLLFGAVYVASAESLGQWLHDAPAKNATLSEEIQCYSLPYGGIGFASHVITYYTIIILTLGRSPWWPFRHNSSYKLDIFLGVSGLVGTIIISTLTMVRCRARWQFVVIAAWKLILSITFNCLSLHAAFLTKSRKRQTHDGRSFCGLFKVGGKRRNPSKILYWLFLYIPGVGAGMVGLISLVVETISTNRTVLVVTAVFGSITFAIAIIAGIIACWVFFDSGSTNAGIWSSLGGGVLSILVAMLLFGVLGAFYSDWILAAVAGNLVGTPSGDNAVLYWSYFILKRFPFLSM